ncbi:MAG: ABC transporter ATP-binding protein [Solirubrobacteraceae bacterium]|nr:ABC transporter ATP-binding protein [Solirubrobacteraceae bacterium]
MTEPLLQTAAVTLAYDERVVVHELDLVIPQGMVTAVVGANGCGKSTLLRALARLMRPRGGSVLLDGASIATLPSREIAKRLGILPQSPLAPDGLAVEDLVGRGRYPHQTLFRHWSAEDEAAVESALAATGTSELRARPLDELSGGQRQRAWIAMTLAQETEILLLDEPTTFLDLTHQIEVLDLLDDLVDAHGRTVVMVLHDLNQACRYADHIVAMRDGRIHAAGAPGDVVDAALVQDVFGLQARVIDDPVTGTPLCLPTGRRADATNRRRARSTGPDPRPSGAEADRQA